MKFKVFTIAFIAASVFAQGASAAQVFNGLDTQGRACQVVFNSLSFGAVVKRDACSFDSDGRGPWCDHAKRVPTRQAVGSGHYATAAGVVPFIVNDQVRFDSPSPEIVADAQGGGYVTITAVGANKVSAYFAFRSEYGKTLTPDQIKNLFFNRPAGVTYQDVYNKIYTDVTCNAGL